MYIRNTSSTHVNVVCDILNKRQCSLSED